MFFFYISGGRQEERREIHIGQNFRQERQTVEVDEGPARISVRDDAAVKLSERRIRSSVGASDVAASVEHVRWRVRHVDVGQYGNGARRARRKGRFRSPEKEKVFYF